MDEKLHRKAYDEGCKTSPKSFNPDFGKHMQKVVQRDIALRKAKQQETKITMRSL
jgi:hypothetical protein